MSDDNVTRVGFGQEPSVAKAGVALGDELIDRARAVVAAWHDPDVAWPIRLSEAVARLEELVGRP